MNPYNAYNVQKQRPMTRVDLIIATFRKALQRLERADTALAAGNADAARPLLTEAHILVGGLAAGMAGSTDELALNFLRLYEFASHKISQGGADDLQAARKALTPLLEAFEAVRAQAAAMEAEGLIPSLDQERQIQVTV
jgi:flagellin-specific chaperone FliS